MKALRADPMSIDKIFSGRNFIIPEFQRPYSWGTEQCEQLWIDITSFIDELIDGTRDNKEQYFLGSIVVYPDEEYKNTLMVIDGQQRLTTLLIIIRLLFESNMTYKILQKIFYKTNPLTDEIIEEPRLESKVLAGGGRNDYKDFRKTMELKTGDFEKKNPYKLNHDILAKKLNEWFSDKSPDQCASVLRWFLENIVMLPIECDSLDDALTLFEIINDRGMSLTDADIFKSKIYKMPKKGQDKERESFIKRWDALNEHETLFRIHMYVVRAEEGVTDKEIALRPYMQKYFDNLKNPEDNWNSIVCSLEDYHSVRTKGAIQMDESAYWDEKIYWTILKHYPNVYWCYPLFVFLKKHGVRENGSFFLRKEKHSQYVELLKNTIRYFYIKGIVYNTVNRVKDTAFKACVAIANGENYIEKYQENVTGDSDVFFRNLCANEYGYRYQKGLVWLCSSLNRNQNREHYAQVLEECHVEHILPWSWANYDKWTGKSHKENIEKIGNKIPVEWKINIQASNEFFKRKQNRYEDSKIQDALDLSIKTPSQWYPKDLDQRQEESINRLKEFFEPIWPCSKKS